MPLPLLLAAPALISAAAAGIKKTVDATEKFQETKRIRERAATDHETAVRATSRQRYATSLRLRKLGKIKFEIYDNELRRFVEAFRQIKHADLSEWDDEAVELTGETLDLGDLRSIDFSAVDGLKTVAVAGGAGAAAGMISFGAVGSFAAASTGTAIGTLSGAAATNATLAWLGGGTLAAGGGGIAAGTMVLGGIVASPLLLVTGFALDAKGKQALADAKADEAKAAAAIAEMAAVRDVTKAIGVRAKDMAAVLARLRELFLPLVDGVEAQVERDDDYQRFAPDEREQLMLATAVALTLRNMIDTPLLTDNGTLTRRSKRALTVGEQLESQLSAGVGSAA